MSFGKLSFAFLLLSVARVAAAAPPPWEAPFGDAAAIAQAAAARPRAAGVDGEILYREFTFRYQADGSLEQREREVLRILTEAGVHEGVEAWAAWQPWFQDRPTLRARVIGTDGVVHELDPSTVEESSRPGASDMYGDERQLRAPLPALAPGVIVEQETVTRDRVPMFDRGTSVGVALAAGWPMAHVQVTVDAPATLPLHWLLHLAPDVKPRQRRSGDRIIVTFERGPTTAAPEVPDDAPAEPTLPTLFIGTGRSWNEVAAGYAAIVAGPRARADAAELSRAVRTALGSTPPKTPTAVVAALLAWIHREVRYTGVEQAQGSIVPRSPTETLQRHYGDCKDQALLLVALLGAAGIHADLALLRVAAGPDLDETLPTLSRFTHAIVHVPGKTPVWVDPTSEWARAGDLPLWDQGRLALIIAPETRGLVRTPMAPAEANRLVETREVFLAERGPGRVAEITEFHGSRERSVRSVWANRAANDRDSWLADYVRTEFNSAVAAHLERDDPRKLDGPLRMRLEVDGARSYFSDPRTATAEFSAASLIDDLPQSLRDGDDGAPARKLDLWILELFVHERVYHIHAPPGYVAAPLPPDVVTPIGPFRLSERYVTEPSGDVTARLRLEVTEHRLTPAQMQATRVAIRTVRTADVRRVRFDQRGRAALEAGRIDEALTEFRRLATRHPQEATHHLELADALLAAGLGSAARVEAARAVALEPASAAAHLQRALILEHDLLGRLRHKGADFSGAEAELRQAKKLAPDDSWARGELAVLLEFNDDGERYGAHARLDQAVAEYRALGSERGDHRLDENVLFCLLNQHKWAELVRAARPLKSTDTRDQLLLVGVAASEGMTAARAVAATMPAERRTILLEEAGEQLVRQRMYAEAATVFETAAAGSDRAASLRSRADLLRRCRKGGSLLLPNSDPASAVQRFLIALTDGDAAAVKSLVARDAGAVDAAGFERGFHAALLAQARGIRLSPQVFTDVALSYFTSTHDGDDRTGYQVNVKLGVPPAAYQVRWYVVREDQRYRLVGANDAVATARHAARLLERGDQEAARRWLGWANDELRQGGKPSPLEGADASASLPPRVQMAAILSGGDGAEDTTFIVSTLEAARVGAPAATAKQLDHLLLATLMRRGRFDDAAALLGRLLPADGVADEDLARARLAAARGQRRWPEVRRLAQARLARSADDGVGLRALAEAEMAEGKLQVAAAIDQLIIAKADASAHDYNQAAWNRVVLGRSDERALEWAREAVSRSQRSRYDSLNTLANVLADLGRGSEAREILIESIEALGRGELVADDFYVLGRIAEAYGLSDEATQYYKAVQADKPAAEWPTSAYSLAQKRLQVLAKSDPGAPSAGR